MAIETTFAFHHLRKRAGATETPGAAVDRLGLLRGFVGNGHQRRWKGNGFNMIWRPNNKELSGPKDFFLELNLTSETLEFTDITGTGIANRGLLQEDVLLGGLAYLQQLKDRFDDSDQHFEPGVWINIPQTSNPQEPATVTRMGTVPHGTTINLQGPAIFLTGKSPVFETASITPFKLGSPDDGTTDLVHFPEEDLSTASLSRTPSAQVITLKQEQLSNPNLFLAQAIEGQTILEMAVLQVTSDTSPTGTVPNVGGGTDNIAFLTGTTGGPNAAATPVKATFWIERVRNGEGREFAQLQYTQRVLLNFNGLSWPHITVGTLTEA